MSKPSTAQKNPEAAEKTASETRATSTTSRKKEEKPGKYFNLFLKCLKSTIVFCNKIVSASAKNDSTEKRSSAVSKKRASVSSASSSKSKVEQENGRGEAVKTAEKKERVPTGKAEERPPTSGAGAAGEENKETTENEDMRKTQSTPVILEKVIFFS